MNHPRKRVYPTSRSRRVQPQTEEKCGGLSISKIELKRTARQGKKGLMKKGKEREKTKELREKVDMKTNKIK